MMSTPKDWKACPSDRARAANEMRNGFERLCDCSVRHAEKFFGPTIDDPVPSTWRVRCRRTQRNKRSDA
jgi:hypothetical protein